VSGTKIDLSGVLAAGREVDVVRQVVIPSADVAFDEPADVRVRLRRVGAGVEIVGRIAGAYSAECARCLEPVSGLVDVEVEERIQPGSVDPFSEANVISDHFLDLDDLARQAVNAALPIAIICDENCPGLCPVCGERRDSQACRCVAGVLEVPWQI